MMLTKMTGERRMKCSFLTSNEHFDGLDWKQDVSLLWLKSLLTRTPQIIREKCQCCCPRAALFSLISSGNVMIMLKTRIKSGANSDFPTFVALPGQWVPWSHICFLLLPVQSMERGAGRRGSWFGLCPLLGAGLSLDLGIADPFPLPLSKTCSGIILNYLARLSGGVLMNVCRALWDPWMKGAIKMQDGVIYLWRSFGFWPTAWIVDI